MLQICHCRRRVDIAYSCKWNKPKLITGHVVLFAAASILQWSDLTFHPAPGWRVRVTRVVIQKLLSATRSVRRFQTDQLHVTNWIHNFISDKVRFHRVFCPVIKPLPRGRVGVKRLILIAKTTWQVPREIHPELFELPCTQRDSRARNIIPTMNEVVRDNKCDRSIIVRRCWDDLYALRDWICYSHVPLWSFFTKCER